MRISDCSSDLCSSYLSKPSFRNRSANAACNAAPRAITLSSRTIWFEWSPQHWRQSLPASLATSQNIAPGTLDRKSVGSGKSVSVRVKLGGGRIIKEKMTTKVETLQIKNTRQKT